MVRRIVVVVLVFAVAIPLVSWARQSGVDAAANTQPPERVLDTRGGLGAARRQLQPGTVVELKLPGVQVRGETVALLNLTADGAREDGFVKAWPCAQSEPETSVLNFVAGRAVPNMVAVGYTSAGICLSSSKSVDLIADLTGTTTEGDLRGISPVRIVDTRAGSPYRANRQYRVDVAGTRGVSSSASLAAINVTVVGAAGDGYVSVSPCNATNASTINYRRGETVAHLTLSALGSGDVCITSSADTHILVDTFAWATSSSEIGALNPDRALDTRSGVGGVSGAVANGRLVTLRLAGRHGVPNDADGVAVNVAALDGRGDGYVKAWPCDQGEPGVSTLNLWNGVLWANQAVLKLSRSGELCLRPVTYNGTSLDMLVDVVGYVEGNVSRTPPPVTLPPVPPPPGGTGVFKTLPPGSALPSGAQCAQLVRDAPEIRPVNATQNATRGTRPNSRWSRVDGNFTGTTDEILQWVACKWGVDEDMVRAQIVKESWWEMSANGDNGESFGLAQVRNGYGHESAFVDNNAINSTAYNVDYAYASWRACFEGEYTWLNDPGIERGRTYAAGDAWGCFGTWFSGRWYTPAAVGYIEGLAPTSGCSGICAWGVKQILAMRYWENPEFINN